MEFKNVNIYNKFVTEFVIDIGNKTCQNWREFLQLKQLGIEVSEDSPFAVDVVYVVTNEKKWLLTKLKYGI